MVLVVSPLVSLVRDQLEKARAMGLRAEAFGSNDSWKELWGKAKQQARLQEQKRAREGVWMWGGSIKSPTALLRRALLTTTYCI